MATVKVRKSKIASTDIGGQKSTRYEKLGVIYGVIPAAGYAINDFVQFPELRSGEIVSATFVSADATPVVVQAFNITNFTSAVVVNVTSGTPVDVAYRIDFVRKAGGVSGNFKIQIT